MSKHRNWCFTLNNYTQDDIDQLRQFCGPNSGIRYLCFQPEQGESGTKHLQGCFICINPRAFNGLRGLFRWHLEVMRGTIEQAIAYCSKEDSRDGVFEEYGERPLNAGRQGGRSDLEAVATAIKAGQRAREIFENFGDCYIKYSKGIERAICLYQPTRTWKTQVFWFHGSTGTGKTRTAFESEPLAYFKSPSHHWWDGYEHQEAVIIDDYRRDFCKFSDLLRLFDRYPLQVQTKGGTVQFTSRRIYVTCPQAPEVIWDNRTTEDIEQLIRRIEVVRDFDSIPPGYLLFPNTN